MLPSENLQSCSLIHFTYIFLPRFTNKHCRKEKTNANVTIRLLKIKFWHHTRLHAFTASIFRARSHLLSGNLAKLRKMRVLNDTMDCLTCAMLMCLSGKDFTRGLLACLHLTMYQFSINSHIIPITSGDSDEQTIIFDYENKTKKHKTEKNVQLKCLLSLLRLSISAIVHISPITHFFISFMIEFPDIAKERYTLTINVWMLAKRAKTHTKLV